MMVKAAHIPADDRRRQNRERKRRHDERQRSGVRALFIVQIGARRATIELDDDDIAVLARGNSRIHHAADSDSKLRVALADHIRLLLGLDISPDDISLAG